MKLVGILGTNKENMERKNELETKK